MVPLKSMNANTYPYPDWSSSLSVNGALGALFDHAIDRHYIWYNVHCSLPGWAVSGPILITPTESPRDFTPSGLGLVHSLAIHYFAYFCRPTNCAGGLTKFRDTLSDTCKRRVTITTLHSLQHYWCSAEPCYKPQLGEYHECSHLVCVYMCISLWWRHDGRDGVSDHQPHDCLLNSLFGRRSKKTS